MKSDFVYVLIKRHRASTIEKAASVYFQNALKHSLTILS